MAWILHDGHQSFNFFFTQFTCSFSHINICFLETNIRESPSYSFDGRHCIHNFGFSIYISIHHTKNVLKLLWYYQCLDLKKWNACATSCVTCINCSHTSISQNKFHVFSMWAGTWILDWGKPIKRTLAKTILLTLPLMWLNHQKKDLALK